MSDFLNAPLELPCPECGSKIRVTLGDIQRGRTITCPSGHRVALQEQGGGIRQADQALDDLKRSIERLG